MAWWGGARGGRNPPPHEVKGIFFSAIVWSFVIFLLLVHFHMCLFCLLSVLLACAFVSLFCLFVRSFLGFSVLFCFVCFFFGCLVLLFGFVRCLWFLFFLSWSLRSRPPPRPKNMVSLLVGFCLFVGWSVLGLSEKIHPCPGFQVWTSLRMSLLSPTLSSNLSKFWSNSHSN